MGCEMGVLEVALIYSFVVGMAVGDALHVEGAPEWFNRQSQTEFCSFTHMRGGYGSVKQAKSKAQVNIYNRIQNIVDIAIKENQSKVRDELEYRLVEGFRNDSNLHGFVARNLIYEGAEYREGIRTAFVKACIPRKVLEDYQKKRLNKISQALSKKRAKDAFDELDSL